MYAYICIYIRMSVSLSPCLSYVKVRDKVASLPMHERVQKTLSLWQPAIRRSCDDLRFLAPRRAPVRSILWGGVEF